MRTTNPANKTIPHPYSIQFCIHMFYLSIFEWMIMSMIKTTTSFCHHLIWKWAISKLQQYPSLFKMLKKSYKKIHDSFHVPSCFPDVFPSVFICFPHPQPPKPQPIVACHLMPELHQLHHFAIHQKHRGAFLQRETSVDASRRFAKLKTPLGWRVAIRNDTRPGELTVCYGKWPFIVDFPMKNGDFPSTWVPSGELTVCHGKIHHAIHGNIHYFDWAIFHCKLLVHQRVIVWDEKYQSYAIRLSCFLHISLIMM